jgi:hypothetical protein
VCNAVLYGNQWVCVLAGPSLEPEYGHVAGPADGRQAGRRPAWTADHGTADSACADGELKHLPSEISWATQLRKDAARLEFIVPEPE